MKKIKAWKAEKTNQGLLITGARQVGKTTLVRQFAAEEYEIFAEINFLETPDAINLISKARNTDDLFLRITALINKELKPGKSLIFFDEVQEFGDILTWAKFLLERTEYDYVFSGSLLGVDLSNVRSWPVGFMNTIEMFPLDFEEFCLASGTTKPLIDVAHQAFFEQAPVPDFIHSKLMNSFSYYILVGGLPEAVQRYIDTNDINALRRAHNGIYDLYQYDITRHLDSREGMRYIKAVYEAIPGQLNKENKRFKFTQLKESSVSHQSALRFSRMESSFDWLTHTGVALAALRIDEPRYSLEMYANVSAFKLYLNDVGLLMSLIAGTASLDVLAGRRDLNYGSVYENVVAQELKSHGHKLYYYNNSKRGEVDFVIQDLSQGSVSLLEVKSGKDYKRHVALSNLIKVKDYDFKNAYVFCNGNIERIGEILYLPIYMAAFL